MSHIVFQMLQCYIRSASCDAQKFPEEVLTFCDRDKTLPETDRAIRVNVIADSPSPRHARQGPIRNPNGYLYAAYFEARSLRGADDRE